jgi:hypothetical protein
MLDPQREKRIPPAAIAWNEGRALDKMIAVGNAQKGEMEDGLPFPLTFSFAIGHFGGMRWSYPKNIRRRLKEGGRGKPINLPSAQFKMRAKVSIPKKSHISFCFFLFYFSLFFIFITK